MSKMKRLTKLIKIDKNLFKDFNKPIPPADVHRLYLIERRRFSIRKKKVVKDV